MASAEDAKFESFTGKVIAAVILLISLLVGVGVLMLRQRLAPMPERILHGEKASWCIGPLDRTWLAFGASPGEKRKDHDRTLFSLSSGLTVDVRASRRHHSPAVSVLPGIEKQERALGKETQVEEAGAGRRVFRTRLNDASRRIALWVETPEDLVVVSTAVPPFAEAAVKSMDEAMSKLRVPCP